MLVNLDVDVEVVVAVPHCAVSVSSADGGAGWIAEER
jgi:hypothetical protein